ncbi:hypothetical protein LMG31506_04683 [Cupriavidus yeoncheonensis]|uniref:HAMP domain-containing protein n=2 Tax=Cupriavidus yeoncheonensis TaxID=1462994 RepID=A0A916MZK1_9BURK|nr:hypothetical protein LMG31506_04683 [Cupriavidus yeoncheonensis]
MESEEDVAGQFESIANARKRIDDKISFLSRTVVSDDGKGILKRVVNVRDKYASETDKILALIRDGKRGEAQTALLSNLRFILADYKKELTAMTVYQSSRMDAIGKESQQSYEQSFTLMLALGAAATLLAALMGYWITRSITRPIHEALKVATTVARGDLSSHIEVTTSDETGQLLRALKDINHSLATIVGEVRTSTDAINGASAQTEEQASSLEETAASMEQLTSTVKQNAENAQQASQLAASASGVARKGGTVVAQVVDTMEAIAESSGRVVEITGVIEGIAFQTNILALNAAVEAARAGEQGRGFAVVAGEVRTLAQRAAAAAKEIKALIDESTSKVNAGGKLVGEAGTTMEEIVASVERVSDLMGEISSATEEQTQGIEQVNEAIAQIEQVTQQNAALVEEASAAAASLQDQAGSLVNAVSVFRVAGTALG